VAHYETPRRIADKLVERVCHDPGLDLGAGLHLAAAASVKVEIEAVFGDGLIAAAGECHLDAHVGELHVLRKAGAGAADAHGKRGVYAGGAHHPAHLLQYGEFFGDDLLHILFLEQQQIAVAADALYEAADIVAPLGELVLHRVPEIGHHSVRLVFDELLVVVDDQQRHHRAGFLVFKTYIVVIRHVYPVSDAHKGCVLPVLAGADKVAVDLVLASSYLQKSGILVFALHKPFAGEFRHHGRELFFVS